MRIARSHRWIAVSAVGVSLSLLAACGSGPSKEGTPEDLASVAEASVAPGGLSCIIVDRGSSYGDAMDATLMTGAYLNVNGGSNPSISATGFNTGAVNFRTLLKFAINANAIPPGASIQSATVTLRPLDPNVGSGQVSFHLATHDWNENTVTTGNYPYAAVVTPLITAPFSGSQYINLDVTQAVIDWVSGAVPNYGVLVTPPPSLTGTYTYSFGAGSSETAMKPYLSICTLPSPCAGLANGTACSDAHNCTSNGTCFNSVCVGGGAAPAGTVCRAAVAACDVTETCNGVSKICPTPVIAASGSVTCRPSAGACDIADVCDGGSAFCPPDTLSSSRSVCRPSAGGCDVVDYCTGSSAQCPADKVQPSTTVCRPAVGPCDVADTCTGSSTQCPADQVQPATTVCRPSAGVCDPPESCTGSSPICPTNTFDPSTKVCQTAVGGYPTCNLDASCTGSSAACPAQPDTDGQYCAAGTGICGGGDCNLICTGGGVDCGSGVAGCCAGTVCCAKNYSTGFECVQTSWCMGQTGDPGLPTCGGNTGLGKEGQECCAGPGGVATCDSGSTSASGQPLLCCNAICQGSDSAGCQGMN